MTNEKYIVYFLSKTKKKMIGFIEKQLHENGLEELITSHGNILTVLYENNEKLTMKEIAQKIGKDKSTVTPLINKLVKNGYVEKQKDAKDKRITHIVLTQKGKNLQPKFENISAQLHQTAYNNFTKEEIEIFLKLLKKMYNNFNEQ